MLWFCGLVVYNKLFDQSFFYTSHFRNDDTKVDIEYKMRKKCKCLFAPLGNYTRFPITNYLWNSVEKAIEHNINF